MILASTALALIVLALILVIGIRWARRKRSLGRPVEQIMAHPRRRRTDRPAPVDEDLEPVHRYYKSPSDGGQRRPERESDDLLPTLGAIAVLSSLGDSSPAEATPSQPPDHGDLGGGGFSTGGGFGGDSGGFSTGGGMDSGGGSSD